ncbi:MAG: DUF4392 domain-containing protein [Planctomycetaceae bacterium]
MNTNLITELERLIRRDPGQRGLLGAETEDRQFALGGLASAARSLADSAKRVSLVTGFYIPTANPPATETDGPPGTLYLARTLQLLGIEVEVITDPLSETVVRSAARQVEFPEQNLTVIPLQPEAGWSLEYLQGAVEKGLTHLISIERVGPGHTAESFQKQYPEVQIDFFTEKIVPEKRGSCHNMRGINVNAWNAPLYELFEVSSQHYPAIHTIGIGDGGNEIGMGQMNWLDMQACLPLPDTAHIPCRVATDDVILAGTSNWGALALAAAVALLKQQPDVLKPWTDQHHLQLLEAIVSEGPAVDGVTGRTEATVDGLPFLTYIQPWILMRQLLEL